MLVFLLISVKSIREWYVKMECVGNFLENHFLSQIKEFNGFHLVVKNISGGTLNRVYVVRTFLSLIIQRF